jgi:hypothetical protein
MQTFSPERSSPFSATEEAGIVTTFGDNTTPTTLEMRCSNLEENQAVLGFRLGDDTERWEAVLKVLEKRIGYERNPYKHFDRLIGKANLKYQGRMPLFLGSSSEHVKYLIPYIYLRHKFNSKTQENLNLNTDAMYAVEHNWYHSVLGMAPMGSSIGLDFKPFDKYSAEIALRMLGSDSKKYIEAFEATTGSILMNVIYYLSQCIQAGNFSDTEFVEMYTINEGSDRRLVDCLLHSKNYRDTQDPKSKEFLRNWYQEVLESKVRMLFYITSSLPLKHKIDIVTLLSQITTSASRAALECLRAFPIITFDPFKDSMAGVALSELNADTAFHLNVFSHGINLPLRSESLNEKERTHFERMLAYYFAGEDIPSALGYPDMRLWFPLEREGKGIHQKKLITTSEQIDHQPATIEDFRSYELQNTDYNGLISIQILTCNSPIRLERILKDVNTLIDKTEYKDARFEVVIFDDSNNDDDKNANRYLVNQYSHGNLSFNLIYPEFSEQQLTQYQQKLSREPFKRNHLRRKLYQQELLTKCADQAPVILCFDDDMIPGKAIEGVEQPRIASLNSIDINTSLLLENNGFVLNGWYTGVPGNMLSVMAGNLTQVQCILQKMDDPEYSVWTWKPENLFNSDENDFELRTPTLDLLEEIVDSLLNRQPIVGFHTDHSHLPLHPGHLNTILGGLFGGRDDMQAATNGLDPLTNLKRAEKSVGRPKALAGVPSLHYRYEGGAGSLGADNGSAVAKLITKTLPSLIATQKIASDPRRLKTFAEQLAKSETEVSYWLQIYYMQYSLKNCVDYPIKLLDSAVSGDKSILELINQQIGSTDGSEQRAWRSLFGKLCPLLNQLKSIQSDIQKMYAAVELGGSIPQRLRDEYGIPSDEDCMSDFIAEITE